MKIKKSQLKQIIIEEVYKQARTQEIKDKSALLKECIAKIERGESLTEEEEIMLEGIGSWLRGASNFVGQKTGQAVQAGA